MATRLAVGASLLALAIMSVASRDGLLVAASDQHEHEQHGAGSASAQPQGTPGTMKMHDGMMAEMKAADMKLDALVNEMNNAATDEHRLAAVTAVVNELVRQHKAMRAHMAAMPMMGGRGMGKGQ